MVKTGQSHYQEQTPLLLCCDFSLLLTLHNILLTKLINKMSISLLYDSARLSYGSYIYRASQNVRVIIYISYIPLKLVFFT